jgi:hypothetical protein
MVGAEPVVRLGTITNRDGGLTVNIVYEGQEAHVRQQQLPSVPVEFLTDDGQQLQQTGLLDDFQEGGFHIYSLKGLGPVRLIQAFHYRHDLEDI